MSVRVYHITVVEHVEPIPAPVTVRDDLQVDYVHRQTLIRTHIAREQCLSHLVRYVQQREEQREREQRQLQRQIEQLQREQLKREQLHREHHEQLQREQLQSEQLQSEQLQREQYVQDLQYLFRRPRKGRNGDYRLAEWFEEKWSWNTWHESMDSVNKKRKLSEM